MYWISCKQQNKNNEIQESVQKKEGESRSRGPTGRRPPRYFFMSRGGERPGPSAGGGHGRRAHLRLRFGERPLAERFEARRFFGEARFADFLAEARFFEDLRDFLEARRLLGEARFFFEDLRDFLEARRLLGEARFFEDLADFLEARRLLGEARFFEDLRDFLEARRLLGEARFFEDFLEARRLLGEARLDRFAALCSLASARSSRTRCLTSAGSLLCTDLLTGANFLARPPLRCTPPRTPTR